MADDGIEPLPSGKLKFTIDDQEYICRRPNFEQFKALNEKIYELQDTASEATGVTENDTPDVSQLRKITDDAFNGLAGFYALMFELLCDTPVADNMIGPWVLDDQAVGQIITHWRTFPFKAPGR